MGLFTGYEDDRAALDLGLHLYAGTPSPNARVSSVRVWFQCKGLHSTTFSEAQFRASEHVDVKNLRVDDVRFWYSSPEPVYLVVYIEAVDDFLAEDVRGLVDQHGGMPDLARRSSAGEKRMTLKIPSAASLDRALARMPHHRSLRMDGPDWRGRPLGHGYDPLRSELARLTPTDFAAMVARLLDVHRFRPVREISIGDFVGVDARHVTATVGKLYLTYEWTSPVFSEFGYDEGSDFRQEASPEYAHGDVMAIVHSDVVAAPQARPGLSKLLKELRGEGIGQCLVFFNESELGGSAFGGWRTALGLKGTPQGLGSLAFNVLTATSVYIEFLDRIRWKHVNYV